jgi:dethiobiotin synthetase
MDLSGIFVVGTDTGVGKTLLSSAIARRLVEQGRRVGVLKPIATGATRAGDSWQSEDGEHLIRAIGGGVALDRVIPIIFEEPLAPSVAARRLGQPLEPGDVKQVVADALAWWADRAEVVVVEGIGGLLTPIADSGPDPCWTVADLAVTLDFPLLIVARRGLGTLNQTLLTVEAATRRGLRVAGVVLNSPEPATGSLAEATNADALACLLDGIPVLGELEHAASSDAVPVAVRDVDWYDRMGRPRLLANH